VNPLRADEIASGLMALASDAALRGTLIDRGTQIAQRASWQFAAEQTWRVYEELLTTEH
jgi:hypothetical protein